MENTDTDTHKNNAFIFLVKSLSFYPVALFCFVLTFMANGVFFFFSFAALIAVVIFSAKGYSRGLKIEISEGESRIKKNLLLFGNFFFLLLGVASIFGAFYLIWELQNSHWAFG